MYAADTQIQLTYPEPTQVESRSPYRKRRVKIREVRDLIHDPLTPQEYLRRPLTHRSRYLLTAFDLDAAQWRQFYLGSSREHASNGRLQIALYEPHGTEPVRVISRAFEPTRRDRIQLARTLKELSEHAYGPLQVRVIPEVQSEPNSVAKPF